METKRLKNIAILILALVNGFLLALLGYQELQAMRASQDAKEELETLFATEELSLSLGSGVMEKSLIPLTLTRQTETESRIAAFLLGEVVPSESQGGGIFGYRTKLGTVQFRAGGGFDTVWIDRYVGDVYAFAQQFCERFDYGEAEYRVENNTGTVTARQFVAGVPVSGCGLTLTFEDGRLVYAAGAHIDLGDAAADREEPLSCVSALMRFFDYRRTVGVVCSEVLGVRCVYQLQNAATPAKLLPVWEIETDTYVYVVDGISAEVSRR